MEIRLQKAIADAGFCSRRTAEEWIEQGFVTVNGKKTTVLGTKVDPKRDTIVVRGKPLSRRKKEYLYFAFHKPRNVMVTASDPEGRPTIFDYLKNIPVRIYPVGRLDFDSEGLLVLTNDGTLTHRLTHPRYKVQKTYEVKITGLLSVEAQKQLQKGVLMDGEKIQPAKIKIIKKNPNNSWIQIIITEGKNRQVRHMMEAVGHEVLKLRRVAVGALQLGELKVGKYRLLSPKEERQLKS